MLISGWILVIAAYGAVWQACRISGIAPWWLGPQTNLRSYFIVMVPFYGPALAAIAAITNQRFACSVGLVAGAGGAAIALGDVRHYPGLALVELAIGVCGLAISGAAFAGRYRLADAVTDSEPSPVVE